VARRGSRAPLPRRSDLLEVIEAHQHHYVPQTLLAGFTEDGTKTGRLHVLDPVRLRTYPSTPEGIGTERDYNLLEVEGEDPLLIESGLFAKEIEAPAAGAFTTIRAGGIPSKEERDRILAFVAMQDLRGPSRREAWNDFTTRQMRLTVDVLTSSEEFYKAQQEKHPELQGITREEAREWAARTKVQNSPTRHLQAQLPSFGSILTCLEHRSWSVLYAPSGSDFICTDNPVALAPSGDRHPLAPRGHASVDAVVFMPIGRSHGLLGTWPVDGQAPQWAGMNADARIVW
jgi:hypothetical protein